MRLLDRYLLRELLVPLGFCLGFLLLFYVAFDLIASLNRLQEHQLLLKDVVEFYLVKFPEILVFILPIALLLALLYTLTNLARHHELTAMRAAGVSLWRLCVPYLVVGFSLSLLAFALNELWVPDSAAKQAEIMGRRVDGSGTDPSVVNNLGFHNAHDGRNWLIGAYHLKTGVMINPHVDWIDRGTNWVIQASSAEHINGVWTFFGSTLFATNDILNLDSLAAKFKTPADPVSQSLNAQFSTATQSLLAKHTNGADPDLLRALADELNHAVYRGPIFDTQRFGAVKLTPDIAELAAQKPQGSELLLLNRALLVAAYPLELSKNSLNGVRVSSKVHSYTNLLAMPQFSETPRQFANEAKFNRRFAGKLSDDSADVPIVEIMEYLKVHPDSTKKLWLLTQFHARFAAPFTA